MKRTLITSKPHYLWEHLEIVLCKTDNPMHPWVTWLHNHTDDGYYHGHYHSDFLEAAKDFASRAVLNYGSCEEETTS